MAIDGCPQTFDQLVTKILPSLMDQMQEAIRNPTPMSDFAVNRIGQMTILKQLGRANEISACYVLLDGGQPIYVGISTATIQRLIDHATGSDNATASLAFRMAANEREQDYTTAREALADQSFKQSFEEKKKYIQSLQVAYVEMDDHITRLLFEIYCAMRFDTKWNSFRNKAALSDKNIVDNTPDCRYPAWSGWHSWSEVESINGAPNEPGVYRVRAVKMPGVPLPISRARTVDEEGIIYIGGGVLRTRIGRLLPSTSGKRHHPLGETYDEYGLDDLCPYDQLEVQWSTVPKKQDALPTEQQIGREYIQRFLNLPPANMKLPGESQRP